MALITIENLGANYTCTLKTLLDIGFVLPLNNYPIFDENYREILNTKIKNRFMFEEIGTETPALFAFHIERVMDEIMPFYNMLYKTALIDLDPNIDFSTLETYTQNKQENKADDTLVKTATTADSTDSSTNTDTQNIKNVSSDTPQNILEIGNIDGNFYASAAEISKNSNTNVQNGTSGSVGSSTSEGASSYLLNLLDNYTRKHEGHNRPIYENLQAIRDLFVNIDMEVLNNKDLNACFMGIF